MCVKRIKNSLTHVLRDVAEVGQLSEAEFTDHTDRVFFQADSGRGSYKNLNKTSLGFIHIFVKKLLIKSLRL